MHSLRLEEPIDRKFNMKTVLFGGSGFLGRHIIPKLSAADHTLTLVTRRVVDVRRIVPASMEVRTWDDPKGITSIIDGSDAVVNLCGESIGAKRWTAGRKEKILSSRVETTKKIVDAIGQASSRPSVLLNASAVGYYGNVETGDVSEDHPPGNDFLANVCVRWEEEAKKAERLGVRVVLQRSGVVLAKDGEAFRRMVLPFKMFVGGTLGSGTQWFPWIHIDDEIGAMMHLLEHQSISGPVNLVAPGSVTMKQYCSALGNAMRHPSWAPVPSFVLRIALGEMADTLVLSGQKAVSRKLTGSGYQFRQPAIGNALAEIVRLYA